MTTEFLAERRWRSLETEHLQYNVADREDSSSDLGDKVNKQYPHAEKARRMIAFFDEQIEEAHRREQADVVLMMFRGESPVGVIVQDPEQLDVAEELGLSGGETVSLLRRLDAEGYLHLSYGRDGPESNVPVATVEYIPDKGLLEIGKLPQPDERLAAAFEAARDTLAADPGVPEPQKRPMLDTLDKTVTVLRTVHGLGDLVQKMLS